MRILPAPDDLAPVFELIFECQSSPETTCSYLGDDPADIRSDLEGLDQPFTATLRIATTRDGALLGAAAVEWDEEPNLAWVYGPWLSSQADDSTAAALVRAMLEQVPVDGAEMYAPLQHTAMARWSEELGWSAGSANLEFEGPAPQYPDGPGGVELRKAAAEDLAAVTALHESAFPGTYATAAQVLRPHDEYTTRVAVDQGTLLGYATVSDTDGPSAYLDYVAVVPAARRRGIGRLLLADAARAGGFERIRLTVDDPRAEAIAFYEGIGLHCTQSTRGYRARIAD